jgi:hypothetical protein
MLFPKIVYSKNYCPVKGIKMTPLLALAKAAISAARESALSIRDLNWRVLSSPAAACSLGV